MQRKLFFFFLLTISVTTAFAQEIATLRPSPLAIAWCKYKDSYLRIVYGQPGKNGRDIFGALVPYGQVWALGANETTELTITREVFINNQFLAAGTYTMFAIPNPDKWTIIVSKDVGMWGAYNYNQANDVLRFDVVPARVPGDIVYEQFNIKVDPKNSKADVIITWDKTTVSFVVNFVEPKP